MAVTLGRMIMIIPMSVLAQTSGVCNRRSETVIFSDVRTGAQAQIRAIRRGNKPSTLLGNLKCVPNYS